MKGTPKSCSCETCMRAKHSTRGRKLLKKIERAFRHHAKQDLASGKEDILPAPKTIRIG